MNARNDDGTITAPNGDRYWPNWPYPSGSIGFIDDYPTLTALKAIAKTGRVSKVRLRPDVYRNAVWDLADWRMQRGLPAHSDPPAFSVYNMLVTSR